MFGRYSLYVRCCKSLNFCRVRVRGSFTEEEAAYLVKQVLEGVAYLHCKGIVHGDLKLENILLEGNMPSATVKIADFGLSKAFSSSPARATVCGSPLYMAPELLTLDQKSELAHAVDVWSVGVILFILLAGYAPFGAHLCSMDGASTSLSSNWIALFP
jgi:serine/threonine protein kinase